MDCLESVTKRLKRLEHTIPLDIVFFIIVVYFGIARDSDITLLWSTIFLLSLFKSTNDYKEFKAAEKKLLEEQN